MLKRKGRHWLVCAFLLLSLLLLLWAGVSVQESLTAERKKRDTQQAFLFEWGYEKRDGLDELNCSERERRIA